MDRVKEQLELWETRPDVGLKAPPKDGASWKAQLGRLLTLDLSFEGQDTSYARHNFHSFPAKFPPQLPRFFIEQLTAEGETVLDPMAGSGTAVLEAALAKRVGVGFDIDPLAVRICRIKTMPAKRETILAAFREVISRSRSLMERPKELSRRLDERFDTRTRQFVNYWFLPPTQLELEALTESIAIVEDEAVRAFLEIALSACIVTKSGGVTLARDLAHSRPHRDHTKKPRSAIALFEQRVRKNLKGLAVPLHNGQVSVRMADSRSLPLEDNSVDLIVTSPPYANAIDYMRAHKFTLVWLGEAIEELSRLRSA